MLDVAIIDDWNLTGLRTRLRREYLVQVETTREDGDTLCEDLVFGGAGSIAKVNSPPFTVVNLHKFFRGGPLAIFSLKTGREVEARHVDGRWKMRILKGGRRVCFCDLVTIRDACGRTDLNR